MFMVKAAVVFCRWNILSGKKKAVLDSDLCKMNLIVESVSFGEWCVLV